MSCLGVNLVFENMFDTLNDKFDKIVRSIRGKAVISEADLDSTIREIRIALLEADVALTVVKQFTSSVKDKILGKEVLKTIKPDQMIIKLVQDELVEILGSDNKPLELTRLDLTKILFCGLQGSGKTTTIAKLANYYKNKDKKIMLVAADTFRAAAVEQLKVWGDRSNVDVISNQSKNADPAAVVFDAINSAKKRNVDLLLVDTAGRLQTKNNLMDELAKIKKIIDKKVPDAIVESLLVLDASQGQNGLKQAKSFAKSADLSGAIITKLDGTSRGGVSLAVSEEVNLPIRFIGAGEGIKDLRPFNSYEFVEAMLADK